MATEVSHPRIFICYARSGGADLAREIQRRLEDDHELPVWRDLTDIEGTAAWWPQVREAIDQVEYLILIMTDAALHSEDVRREWRYARRVGTCVIPIQEERDQNFGDLPRWMARQNFVAWWDYDSWRRLVRTLESPCSKIRVPFMVGDLPSDYVARPTEFNKLHAQLVDDRRQHIAITTALKGAGGFGKTTLAKALCHDETVRDAFADGILWVTLGQTPSEADLVEHIRDLIEALTGKRPGFASIDAAAGALAGALADREALIVIDDVWRRADSEPFLQGGPDCSRLITTRISDVLPRESKRVEVDAMQPEQASELLRHGLPDGHDQAIAALAARLGQWPLLLKLANRVLHFRVVEASESLADAIAFANEALDEVGLHAFDPKNERQRDRAAAASIAASVGLLGDDERARFEELDVFAKDAEVPLDLVAGIWARTGGLSGVQAEQLWTRLFQASLVLRLDLKAKRLQLHDVVRAYLQTLRRPHALHRAVVDVYGAECSERWHEGPNDGYFFQYLPWHLCEAGQAERLHALLFDYRWLRAKLGAVDVNAAIDDLERLGTSKTAAELAGALRLSADVLAEKTGDLAGQLIGRLAGNRTPELVSLVEAAQLMVEPPALVPRISALTPPGTGLIRTFRHRDAVSAIAVLPDGKHAITCSADGIARLWDLEGGEELKHLKADKGWVRAVAVSADGEHAIIGSDDGLARLWDLKSGQEMQCYQHNSWISAVAMLPDGKHAITGSADGIARLWDLKSGKELRHLKADKGWVRAVAVSADGEHAITGSDDGLVRLWDLKSGQEIQRYTHDALVSAVGITPDGLRAITGSDDKLARLWHLKKGRQLKHFDHGSWVSAVAVLPDGDRAITGSDDGIARLWDLENGEELQRFKGHEREYWRLRSCQMESEQLPAQSMAPHDSGI
jgi:WD40 repeat protein